jgi:hypothetical protein
MMRWLSIRRESVVSLSRECCARLPYKVQPVTHCADMCRSYYSIEGCTGNAAQYDLVSEKCSVYGYPLGAFGTFKCDAGGKLWQLYII